MYACPECKKIFKVKGNDKKVKCSQCKTLMLIDLKIDYDEWNSLSKYTRADIIRVKLDRKESNELTDSEVEIYLPIEEDKGKSFFDEIDSKDDPQTSSEVLSMETTDEAKNSDLEKVVTSNNTKNALSKRIDPKYIVIASIVVALLVGFIIISLLNRTGLSTDVTSSGTNLFSNNGKTKITGSENFNKTLDLIQEGDLSRALEIYRTLSSEEKAKIDENIMENVNDYAHFISRVSVEDGVGKAKECLEEMAPSASENIEFQQGVFSEVMTLLNNDYVLNATALKSIITDETLINDFYNACYNIAKENLMNGICDNTTSTMFFYLPVSKYPDAKVYKQLVDFVINIRENPSEIAIKDFPTIIETNVIEYCPEDCKTVVNDIKTELEKMSGCYRNIAFYIAIKNYRIGYTFQEYGDVEGLDYATYNKDTNTFHVLTCNTIKR